MYLSSLRGLLFTAAVTVTSVHASPFAESFNALQARDLAGEQCKALLFGADSQNAGQVCVSINPTTLTVTYPTLPEGGNYTDLHVQVQTTPITEDNQGKWLYTLGNGNCTITNSKRSASCSIKVDPSWLYCNKDLYIGVHASFNWPDKGGVTGWADGTCISTRPNCPRYFTFTTKCECKVITEYDPVSTTFVYTSIETIYNTYTKTKTCTTEVPPVTVTTTCANPSSGAIETKHTTSTPADFSCTTPPP